MALVKFKDVGRMKKCWEQEVDYPTEDRIILAVKRKNCLLSKTITAEYDTNAIGCKTGEIHAGFYTVGRFEVVE